MFLKVQFSMVELSSCAVGVTTLPPRPDILNDKFPRSARDISCGVTGWLISVVAVAGTEGVTVASAGVWDDATVPWLSATQTVEEAEEVCWFACIGCNSTD